MRGKEKCKALKEIRRQIAEKNDIEFVVSECKHQGDCKGTCPKCEAEVRYLERELALKQSLGKAVAVAGITAGVCTTLTACNPVEAIADFAEDIIYEINPVELDGDVMYIEGDTEMEDPDDYEGGIEYIPDDSEEETEEILMGDMPYIPDDSDMEEDYLNE